MNAGGTEKSLLNLIGKLSKRYEVTILLLERKGLLLDDIPKSVKIEEIENAKKINFFIAKGVREYINYFYLKELKFIQTLKYYSIYFLSKLLKNEKYNYLIISDLFKNPKANFDIAVAYAGPHNFISYYVAKKIQAQRKIQWIHFDVSKIHFNINFSKYLYNFFDEIYTVSEEVKNQLLKKNPVIKNKTKIFYNLISEEEIKNKANEFIVYNYIKEYIKIVTIGRLSKEKGHKLFIPALKKLIDEGFKVKWIIVGDGNMKEYLEELSVKLNIDKAIQFIGYKSNPYPYIKGADLFLQPSYYEGHAVSILEAKVFNIPIVVTNFAGASEEIIHKKTGYIVPISTEGLYQGVKEMLQNSSLREKLSFNLKKEAEGLKVTQKIIL